MALFRVTVDVEGGGDWMVEADSKHEAEGVGHSLAQESIETFVWVDEIDLNPKSIKEVELRRKVLTEEGEEITLEAYLAAHGEPYEPTAANEMAEALSRGQTARLIPDEA